MKSELLFRKLIFANFPKYNHREMHHTTDNRQIHRFNPSNSQDSRPPPNRQITIVLTQPTEPVYMGNIGRRKAIMLFQHSDGRLKTNC